MFNKSNFCHIASNNRNDQKGSVFIYKTSDSLSQVTQSGYFNEKLIDINVHDLIIHVQYNPVARTLKKSLLIVTERTMDNVETAPILDQTIGDDLADLGDQVAGIEEKIPSNASATNQLATESDITNKITNCLTEIPQDIKLELNNGTLTLKAGSKVYVPNGAGVFNELTLTADKTSTQTPNDTRMYFYNGSYIEKFPIAQCFSGSSAPSGYTYMFWYDTTNNVVKKTSNSGSTWESGWSLPFCIATASGGALTSIDQVFNGFGYIGSTIFALPGVKGLVPNGRNADGTLKSVLIQINSVITRTFNATGALYIGLQTTGFGGIIKSNYSYDPDTNIQYSSGTAFSNSIVFASCDMSSGVISNWTVLKNNPFHAVDYNDFEELDNSAVHKTGNETIGGEKTFTSGTIWKKENWDVTQNPTSNKFAMWSQVCDTEYNLLSYIETSHLTDGTIQQTIGARKEINGTTYTASFKTRVDANGNAFVELGNNPANSSNGLQVATTYWANAKFLQLAGGTITGAITTKSQILFENANSAGHRGFLYKVSDGGLAMGIQNSDNSGWQSYQSFFTNGQYLITVSDGTNSKQLNAKPDGTLTWDGKQIIRLVAEQKATSANNYKWYRKYSDGWVEQGGIHHRGSAGDTVNLPIAMSDAYYELQLTAVNSDNINRYAYANSYTSTYFKCGTADDQSPNNDGDIRWYVCGYAAN